MGTKSAELLVHMGEIFQVRSVGDGGNAANNVTWLWRREEVLEWLFGGCVYLLRSLSSPELISEVVCF